MKILTFPFHSPYQIELFKTGHHFTVVDRYNGVLWGKNYGSIQSNHRELPYNAELISADEMLLDFDYDVVILPTIEHIRWLGSMMRTVLKVPTIYCHATAFPVPQDIKDMDVPIVHTCVNWGKLRDKDIFIPHGHDHHEFYFDESDDRSGIIYPINRFRAIGNELTGYNNSGVINMANVRVIGHNPEYPGSENLSYDGYKKSLRHADIGLQLSPYKHRTFTTSEMMLSGDIVIFAKEKPEFHHKEMTTFIKNDENGFVVHNNPISFYKQIRKIGELSDVEKENMRLEARETIIREQPLADFIDKWNEVIEYV